MTALPSNAEVVAALRQLFSSSPVMLAGSPEAVAEDVLRIVRLAATQEQRGEPAREQIARVMYEQVKQDRYHGEGKAWEDRSQDTRDQWLRVADAVLAAVE